MHYICFCMACFFTYAYYYNLWVYKMGLLSTFFIPNIRVYTFPYFPIYLQCFNI